jgi:hypothetical protein
VALISEAAKNVTGQIFGASGENIILYSQPRPIETLTKAEGWTPSTIISEAFAKMADKFYPLSRPIPSMSQAAEQAPAAAG